MRTLKYFGISAVAALSLAMVGSPASADAEVAVLTSGSLGGANVAVGDVLTAALAAGTTANFVSASGGSTGVKCTESAFAATVTDNPVAPGVATESVTSQTFGSCTSNTPGTTSVKSISVDNVPLKTTVASGTGAVTVSGTDAAPFQTTLKLGTILGSITCVYRANGNAIAGLSSNTDNSISFVNQHFVKSSGSLLCPANGYFTATYAPVLDSNVTDSPAVFTN